ncbi:MAG: acyl carrier protein [Lachnospiraceae bacterium]|nr:acyl carrier protein [Lachnospiraceae bacterium]
MTRTEIFIELKSILLSEDERNSELLESCTEETELVSDLNLNSVGILYLVISIEETFQIRFENSGIADFRTVGDVITYIQSKLGE